MNIPFTKLHQQYLDCKTEIDAALAGVIANSSFITGPDVTHFESTLAQYVGAEDCASTGSGTMALLCSLRAAAVAFAPRKSSTTNGLRQSCAGFSQ